MFRSAKVVWGVKVIRGVKVVRSAKVVQGAKLGWVVNVVRGANVEDLSKAVVADVRVLGGSHRGYVDFSGITTRWTTTLSSKVNLPPRNSLQVQMWCEFGHVTPWN